MGRLPRAARRIGRLCAIVRNRIGNERAVGTDRGGASEHKAAAAAGALEHELRPPEGLGTPLIRGEALEHRLVRRRAVAWRGGSGAY